MLRTTLGEHLTNNPASERVILKDPEFENNKTPRTRISQIESLSDKGRRKRNTIKPANTFEENDSLHSRYARNSKVNPRKLFTDNAETNNSDAARNIFRRSDTKLESTSKRKCKSTKKERQEKSSRLRNSKDCLESSSDSSTLIKNSRSNLVSNQKTSQRTDTLHGNDNTNIENILNKTVKQASFHLRSPKLLLNSDKLSTSNQTTDSPVTVTTGDGFEIESSEISSDDVSFSVQRIKFDDILYHQQISDLLRNSYSSTRDDQIYNQPGMLQNKIFSWILPNNNLSESDTTTFSDDAMSSVGYSPMDCDESTLAMIDRFSTSDVDVQMDNSTVLSSESQIFMHGNGDDTDYERPNFSLNSFKKREYRCDSPCNERSLPFKKRQMQWNSLLDPLESALTTSMEKLNEIRNDF